MLKGYINFVRKIYSYCDRNIGEEVLFPVFTNLWNDNENLNSITKKDLAILTSRIISNLINKKVLSKVHSNSKFHDIYGFYKILPHEYLIRYNYFA